MTSAISNHIATTIEDEMNRVDAVIEKQLQSSVPLVGDVSHHIVQSGGKRLRPRILLLCSGAYGCQSEQRYSMAAVIEFIHTATLLHDDVVDDSTLRRGHHTANHQFGNPVSVLVGDFLYSRAFQMMVDIKEIRVMEVLARATNMIAEGEVLQLMNMRDPCLTESDYLKVIQAKTAKLFEASARVAAILAKASSAQEEYCAHYGQSLGIAFQIVDDILDYVGDPKLLGKNVGDDLREGKNTLPLIAAMKLSNASEKALIEKAIVHGELDQLEKIIQIVQHSGALEMSKQQALHQVNIAIDACHKMPDNEYRTALIDIAHLSLNRFN